MDARNIAAFTPAIYDGPYPSYISINDMGGDIVRITIRQGGAPTASIDLHRDDWLELRTQINARG